MSDSEEELLFKKKKSKKDTSRSIQSSTLDDTNADELVNLIEDTKRSKTGSAAINIEKERVGGIELPTITSTYDPTPDKSRVHEVAVVGEETVSESDKKLPKWMRIGQMKQSAYARAISMFDFAADICKDYKETGRCAWGDECKFMHDRSERKSGAQLEREWQSKNSAKRLDDEETAKPAPAAEAVPEDCGICGKKLVNPVFTKCKHVFCEACALKQHAAKKTCFTCGAATDGSFISAKKYLADLSRAAATDDNGVTKNVDKRGFQSGGSWGYGAAKGK